MVLLKEQLNLPVCPADASYVSSGGWAVFAGLLKELRGFWCSCRYGTVKFNPFRQKEEEKGEGRAVSAGYPASLLVTSEDLRCGRSCGVGMWSPVTRFLSGPALGSCLFFIFALAML